MLIRYSTDVNAAAMAHIARLPALQSLELRDCFHLDDECAFHIGKLQTLESLSMSLTFQLTDAGMQHLSQLGALTALTMRNFREVTDLGIEHLTGLPSLQCLTMVCEYCDRITDTGLAAIARISSLRELHLEGLAWITVEGAKQLLRLPFLTRLKFVNCDAVFHDSEQFHPHACRLTSLHYFNEHFLSSSASSSEPESSFESSDDDE